MKRVLFLSMPMLLLTVLLVSQPPRSAEGQARISGQDTIRRKAVLPDSIDLAQELDSNRRILNEIQGNVQGIKKGVNDLVKDRNSQKRIAAKVLQAEKDTVKDTVRVADTVLVTVPVETVDSTMDGRTWWGQMFQHVKRCRVGKIFKPRQWGKGKF